MRAPLVELKATILNAKDVAFVFCDKKISRFAIRLLIWIVSF
jgi:hypothetical protein